MQKPLQRKTENALTNPGHALGTAHLTEDGFSIFSASQIGESNKRRILQTLFDRGPTSRADLARLSGTKRTTITGIVQPLIDGGLLVEVEPGERRGVGKPAKPLWFSAAASPVCATTLMPGRVQSAMVGLTGDTYARQSFDLDPTAANKSDYLTALKTCISASLEKARNQPLGIGIAVGGMVDPDTGSIVAMNLAPFLAGLELKAVLEAEFGLATYLDHHPRAILLGERWFGLGRGLKDFSIIYADEVLGCSLYLNGEPFRGPHGSGGELGHTVVDIEGEICTCGKRGCWETVATLPWLRLRARTLSIANAETLDVPGLCALAENGGSARALLFEYARNLAIGMANLQTLLMPSNFIIYGNAARGTEALRSEIEKQVIELSPPSPREGVHVQFGKDERATTLRGAAGLVISEKLRISY